MATNEEVLFPKALVIPTGAGSSQLLTTAPTGSIAISGAKLVFHNGTGWVEVTSG